MKTYNFRELAELLQKPFNSIQWYYYSRPIVRDLFIKETRNKRQCNVLPAEKIEKYVELISGKTIERWTPASIECYHRNLVCIDCPNNYICQSVPKKLGKPPMKWMVLKLYADLGKPKEIKNENENY